MLETANSLITSSFTFLGTLATNDVTATAVIACLVAKPLISLGFSVFKRTKHAVQ